MSFVTKQTNALDIILSTYKSSIKNRIFSDATSLYVQTLRYICSQQFHKSQQRKQICVH